MEKDMAPYYYNAFEQGVDQKLRKQLQNTIMESEANADDIVVLCIGTDRATGDCLGPLVGEHLKHVLPEIRVYGTLENPVHALNLEETVHALYKEHANPYIIAIDASLGVPEHIGYITLSQTPLMPGKGVNKKLPAIGHLSITGIVNVAGFPNSILLQSTRLHTVMTLADCISSAICQYFTATYDSIEQDTTLYLSALQ